MITRNFNLYLNAGHSVPLVINVNQYDSGEQWVFTLYNSDGTKYTPSTGAIVGIKSDGLGIINSGSVVDGNVVINETQQMTAAVGKAVFELMIDSQTHGTANFIVLVEEKPGNNADLSESDLSLLQEAIDATSPLPTGGTVGQVLTKTASGSTWSDAGTPTQEQVADAVSDWADEHITVSTGVVIDTSLSVAGAAADAKATGDEITDLKSAFDDSIDRFDDELHSFPTFKNGGSPVLGRLDTATDIDAPETSTARAVLAKFVIHAPSAVTPNPTALSGNFGVTLGGVSSFPTTFKLYRQKNGVLEFLKTLTSSYVIDDIEAEYRLEISMTGFGNSSTPKFSEIIGNSDIATQIYATVSQADRTRLDEIDEGIADLPEIRNEAKTALDFPLNISTEIGYFSADDLRENVSQNKRARTGIFRIYKPSVLRLSVTDGSFTYYVFKQTFTDGVQTTTALTSSWTGNIEYYVLDADPNANYRIMLRKDGGDTSLVDYDFSQLYITCENVEPATPYLAEETRFYNEVNKAVSNNTIIAVLNTDNHYNDADYRDCLQVKYANAIAKMGQRVSAEFMINLGDIVEGFNDNLTVEQYNQQYSNYKRIEEMVNALTSTEIPLIYAVGHHEMYPISDSFDNGARTEHRGYTMSNVYRQIFGEMDNNAQLGFRRSLKSACVDDDPANSLSFYFDYTKDSGTIRFLVIDGCDYSSRGYSEGTINFVTTALQDAKTNSLPVIIMCHIPPISAGVINVSTTEARNEAALNEAIDGVGANILAWLHGHVHCDNVITDMTSYPIVAFDAQKLYRQWSSAPNIHGSPTCPSRTVGTYSEYAFDVLLIRTTGSSMGTIYCYRFGAGDTGTYPTRTITQ